jgi:hypothetical protein
MNSPTSKAFTTNWTKPTQVASDLAERAGTVDQEEHAGVASQGMKGFHSISQSAALSALL